MKILLIGFGTVGQGLAELLVGKGDALRQSHGLDIQVVGIADMLNGSIYNASGIDLAAALEAAAAGGQIDQAGDRFEGDALAMIQGADADAIVEATYTDLETGEPGTTHVRAALEKGMHVTTTNKGPVALHLAELTALAQGQ